MKKALLMKSTTSMELYFVEITVFVARDPAAALSAVHLWAGDTRVEDFLGSALCAYRDHRFLMAFVELTHNTIAHEIFHCVHGIMERTGDKFTAEHHEPYAYLQGWIAEWVYSQLKKAKIRVSV